eukprot:942795_1
MHNNILAFFFFFKEEEERRTEPLSPKEGPALQRLYKTKEFITIPVVIKELSKIKEPPQTLMMQWHQPNGNEQGSTSTEEQSTRYDEIQPLPLRNASQVQNDFSNSECLPMLLPRRIQRNLPAMEFHERVMPPLPFEEGSKSYAKNNKDAIRNFGVRIQVPDLSYHSTQKSPISNIGYAAVNPKYLFRPI